LCGQLDYYVRERTTQQTGKEKLSAQPPAPWYIGGPVLGLCVVVLGVVFGVG